MDSVVIPPPFFQPFRLRLLVIDILLVSGWAQTVDSWVTGAIRTSWTAATTRMLAVRTMKRSVKIFLAWRHKDKQDSGDESDASRQDNEEVS